MSRRYTIAIADSSTGIERRVTVSVAAALATLTVILTLPVLIGIGVAWRATAEAQRVHARYRTLDIERANYRAATEALAKHIDSREASNSALDPDSSASTGTVPELDSSSPARSGLASSGTATSLPAPAEKSDSAQKTGSAPSVTPAPQKGAAQAADGDRGSAPSSEREVSEVLIRLGQRRALAEGANAETLASRAFQEGIALETEARQLAQAGRTSDALLRAVAADARFRMAESEARSEAAAQERARLANESPTRPVELANPDQGGSARPTPTSATQKADAEKSIRGVIAEYVSGLESRNVAALKRVWPSLGGNQEKALRTEFANARAVQALFHDPRITINDDTTTVTGLRSYRLETQDGQNLSTTTRTTITLRRVDGVWVIEQVVHHP
jgi:hypothetical protein